jgi:hypothetical protein
MKLHEQLEQEEDVRISKWVDILASSVPVPQG